jgi:hypothetical protein
MPRFSHRDFVDIEFARSSDFFHSLAMVQEPPISFQQKRKIGVGLSGMARRCGS